MSKFEYKVVKIYPMKDIGGPLQVELQVDALALNALNDLGNNGWEVVAFLGEEYAFLKKRIE